MKRFAVVTLTILLISLFAHTQALCDENTPSGDPKPAKQRNIIPQSFPQFFSPSAKFNLYKHAIKAYNKGYNYKVQKKNMFMAKLFYQEASSVYIDLGFYKRNPKIWEKTIFCLGRSEKFNKAEHLLLCDYPKTTSIDRKAKLYYCLGLIYEDTIYSIVKRAEKRPENLVLSQKITPHEYVKAMSYLAKAYVWIRQSVSIKADKEREQYAIDGISPSFRDVCISALKMRERNHIIDQEEHYGFFCKSLEQNYLSKTNKPLMHFMPKQYAVAITGFKRADGIYEGISVSLDDRANPLGFRVLLYRNESQHIESEVFNKPKAKEKKKKEAEKKAIYDQFGIYTTPTSSDETSVYLILDLYKNGKSVKTYKWPILKGTPWLTYRKW